MHRPAVHGRRTADGLWQGYTDLGWVHIRPYRTGWPTVYDRPLPTDNEQSGGNNPAFHHGLHGLFIFINNGHNVQKYHRSTDGPRLVGTARLGWD